MSDEEQSRDDGVPADADLEGDNPPTAPDGEAVGGFPEPPGTNDPQPDPDADPHHAQNNRVGDPDPTVFPHPYETPPDPRAPEESAEAAADDHRVTPSAPSTSEPPPPRNPDEQRHERASSKGAHKRDRP